MLPFLVSLVHHYTMVAVGQQAGPLRAGPTGVGGAPGAPGTVRPPQGMDPTVLIDALAAIMAHEEKELCKVGQLALLLIAENSATILTSKERVSIRATPF